MRFKFLILIIIFFLKIQFSFSQADKITTVYFTAKFGNSSLFLNDVIYLKNSDDSIKIESLKFYISNIEFLDNDKSMWQEKNSFHLVDVSNDRSMKLLLKTNDNIKFNKIKFNLGIDSAVNVSGAMG